jgi:hypothetical protein
MAVCSFVVDGCWRARAALEPVIRSEVRKEYVERLTNAKPWAKVAIWLEMEREISRRIESKAPSDGLY